MAAPTRINTVTDALQMYLDGAWVDVTGGSGGGSVDPSDISPVVSDRLLGRDSAGSGAVEEISLNATLEFTGSQSIQRAALTGDVTASAGSNSTTIANDAVSNAKMADMAQATVKGRASGAGTGDPTDLTGAQVLAIIEATTPLVSQAEGDAAYQPLDSDLTSWAGVTRAAGFDTFAATPSSANLASLVTGETGSGALVFATSPALTTPNIGTPSAGTLTNCTGLPTTGLVDDAVTYAKIQDVTNERLLGNASGSAASPSEIALGNGLEFNSGSPRVKQHNTNGLLVVSSSGVGARWPMCLQFGCSSAASTSRFNLYTDRTVCTTTAGFRAPLAGRIVWTSVMVNVSNAVDVGQTLTINTRINNSAQAAVALTITSADGTGDIGKTVTGVTTVTFSAGDFITSHSTLSGGTTTWDEVFHAIGLEFDIA